MCDSRVFLIRNFWKDERPTSTEYETATEHSFYPKSETDTEISERKSDQSTETITNHIQNPEIILNKIKRYQEKVARLTTENGAAEDNRIQLEIELLTYKSRIDQLVTENRRLEIKEKKYRNKFNQTRQTTKKWSCRK